MAVYTSAAEYELGFSVASSVSGARSGAVDGASVTSFDIALGAEVEASETLATAAP